VTVNLAVAFAARGLRVGVLDADIHGHSVPRMLGADGARPTQVERMMMPPQARGIRLISVGMFTEGNTPVVWRGPMLHRALQQFLADVFWGDLDILLLDLPPGTGDIAVSLAQMLPTAEILVVTTPQPAAAEVAERAGSVAARTQQKVAGVIENMSWYEDADGGRVELFGSGGGAAVAESLSHLLGAQVPLLAQIPFDQQLRESGDTGTPFVVEHADSAAGRALTAAAEHLAVRPRGLARTRLTISPTRR
jgi:ATP-binding protein involved in chromosome partitioning